MNTYGHQMAQQAPHTSLAALGSACLRQGVQLGRADVEPGGEREVGPRSRIKMMFHSTPEVLGRLGAARSFARCFVHSGEDRT